MAPPVSKPNLTVVGPESPAAVARRLLAEAEGHAGLAVRSLINRLVAVEAEAVEVASLPSIKPGIRDRARQLAEQARHDRLSISLLMERGA